VNRSEIEGAEMKPDSLVMLRAGNLRLTLKPSIGGSISSFEWTNGNCSRTILRKCNSAFENVLDAACFPLVPYVNRVRDGRFTFRGRDVRLTANMRGDPSPLHGQGWLNPWRVEEASDAGATLAFHHAAGEWPWDYDARQDFALDPAGLSVRLSCRNGSADPMPCGLGEHPYFPCGPTTRIDTDVTDVWTIDQNVLPVEKVAAVGRFGLSDRPVCGQDLDHGFAGWSGSASLTDPDWPYDLRLSSPTAKFFQLYSPSEGRVCVAEPVTHANAALNAPESEWPELGMRVLQPGEEMSLDVRLAVIPK
jgi:aldose 1-epimerase